MKVLNKISGRLTKYANRRYILPLMGLLILILIAMERGPFGSERIRQLSGGVGTLDMTFGYSAAQAYSLLFRIGHAGRELYVRLLGLDFLFAVVYMSLQALLVTALIRKTKLGARWEKLNLLPVLRSALDVVENVLLLVLIAGFPGQNPAVVTIASVITVIKLTLNYAYIAIVLAMGAMTTQQAFMKKGRKQNSRETGGAA